MCISAYTWTVGVCIPASTSVWTGDVCGQGAVDKGCIQECIERGVWTGGVCGQEGYGQVVFVDRGCTLPPIHPLPELETATEAGDTYLTGMHSSMV